MTVKTIALRNLMRRKSKAAFVFAGLVIGIATIVTVITAVESMTSDINEKLEKYGANILVVPKTENLTLSYGGLSLGGVSFEMQEIQQQELSRISTIQNSANVAAVGPITLGVVEVNSHQVLLAGVDMETSYILKPWWKVNGDLPRENQVLIGAESARIMNVTTGDQLHINGQTLPVAGVLEATGSQDDQLVFSRLATAQTLLSKEGKVSMAEVAALCKDCPIEEMVRQISDVLPGARVMAIQQVVKGRMQALHQFRKFSYGVSIIILLVGSLVVLVTMMSSVRERTEEIGIFRAIGFRRSHVMHIILLEAAIISVLAGISGYVSGLGATKLVLRFFTENASAAIPIHFELAVGSILLALVMGLLSSSYPALMAARLDPNDALRAL
jgi:putative ABC transport system permease protein